MRIGATLLLLSPLLGLAVVAGIALNTEVSLGQVSGLIPLPNHLLALGAVTLSLLGRGARMAMLARGLGTRLGLLDASATQLAGEAAAAATPSRAGSDPTRIFFLRSLGLDLPTAVSILAGEIMAEGLVLAVVVATLFLFLPGSNGVVLGALPYAATSLTLPLLAFLSVRHPGNRIPPRSWKRLGLSERRWRAFRMGGRRFRSKARELVRLKASTIIGVLLASMVHILARLLVLPVLSVGVSWGVGVAPLVAWPLFLLYTGSLLPLPGGGGVVEITFISALSGALAGGGVAGVLLWWRFYTFYLGAMVGALVILGTVGWMGLSEVGRGWKGSRSGSREVIPLPESR